MTWMLERQLTLQPSRCALVWFPKDGPRFTVATFRGAEGQGVAERILEDLRRSAEPGGPEQWKEPT